jgi:hypothetical protein
MTAQRQDPARNGVADEVSLRRIALRHAPVERPTGFHAPTRREFRASDTYRPHGNSQHAHLKCPRREMVTQPGHVWQPSERAMTKC